MVVEKGYKQTEIGVIPEDWEVKFLGNIGKFSKGSGIRKNESNSGSIPCVRYGELYTRHNDYIKNFYSYISEEVSKTSQKIKNGDILFAGSGETKEEIGKAAAYLFEIEAYAGGDIVILTPSNINSKFLGYLLNAPVVQQQKAQKGQGDAVVHISSNQLSEIIIPLPPLPEQTAIATALSDMDALIAQTEKLIEKKKAIKQGAMQELLRPKEGWVKKKLGEVCEIRKGQLITESTRVQGKIPVIAGGKTPAYYHNKSNRTGKTITISGSGANAGYISIHRLPIFASDCCTISESVEYDVEFLFYWMQLNQKKIYSLQTGGAQPHIHPIDLKPIEIYLPLLIYQNTISRTLYEIDSEIDLIESKLQKLKLQKQGMMQALLTGKIRLV